MQAQRFDEVSANQGRTANDASQPREVQSPLLEAGEISDYEMRGQDYPHLPLHGVLAVADAVAETGAAAWRLVWTAPDGTTNSCARVRIASDGHVDRVVERSDGMSGRVLASAEVGPDGLVASETDDLSATTLRDHDAFGRVLSETGAPERTVAFAYPEPVRGGRRDRGARPRKDY